MFKALGPEISGILVIIGSGICAPAQAACAAAGSYEIGRAHGLSSAQAFKSGLSAGVAVGAGQLIGDFGLSSVTQRPGLETAGLHAAAGCASASIAGGDCQSGAISAALGKAAAPHIQTLIGNATYTEFAMSTAFEGVVTGTISELTGGKFASGAVTGAALYAYNQARGMAASRAAAGGAAALGGRQADQTTDLMQGSPIQADPNTMLARQLTHAWNELVSVIKDAFDGLIFAKPPADAYDVDGPKAPGKPGADVGFKDPKSGENWVRNPNGRGYGWEDSKGNVWIPTGPNEGHRGDAHGGPHWDVQYPNGGYRNIRPIM